MAEDQTSLEGFVVLRLEDLEEAVERVLKKHGILGPARKRKTWDRGYKGDPHWLLVRAKVLGLVRDNLIVSYSTLKQDPWFVTNEKGPIRQPLQWQRARDDHLIPNKPEGPDGLPFRAFQLRSNGTIYLTIETYLHCGIARAAKGRKDAAGLIRKLRRLHRVEARCAWCVRQYGAEGVEENLQPPVITHTPAGEESLSEDEGALLQARIAEDP